MNDLPAFGKEGSYTSVPRNLIPKDGRMDPLDIRIMCHLGMCPNVMSFAARRRPDPAEVAKELKIDGKTVRSRMERWEKTGFIKYYQILPNNNILGIKSSLYLFSFDDIIKKYEAIKKVRLVEGVLSIVNALGLSFGLWLAYEDEEERDKRLSLLAEVTGCQEPPKITDDAHDPVTTRLSSLDWKIIKCLRHNALKPLSAIAEDCHVTRKTAKLHLERMIQGNAFYMRAIFDASRVIGLILYALAAVLDEDLKGEALRELTRMFRENAFAKWESAGNILFSLWSISAGEPEDSYVKARNVKGVVHVEVQVVKELIEFPGLVDKLVERKLREVVRSSAPASEAVRLSHEVAPDLRT